MLTDADTALEYRDNSLNGVVKQLTEVHALLVRAYTRVENEEALVLLDKALLKIEAQLDY